MRGLRKFSVMGARYGAGTTSTSLGGARFIRDTAIKRTARVAQHESGMTSAQHDAIARSKATLPHQILGVPSGIDEPTLRKAYRACAKLLHPDKCSLPEADAAFKRVAQAFEQLLHHAPPSKPAAPPAAAAAASSGFASTHAKAPAPAPKKAFDHQLFGQSVGNDKIKIKQAKAPRKPRAPAPSKRPAAQPTPQQQVDDDEDDDDEEESEEESDEGGIVCQRGFIRAESWREARQGNKARQGRWWW